MNPTGHTNNHEQPCMELFTQLVKTAQLDRAIAWCLAHDPNPKTIISHLLTTLAPDFEPRHPPVLDVSAIDIADELGSSHPRAQNIIEPVTKLLNLTLTGVTVDNELLNDILLDTTGREQENIAGLITQFVAAYYQHVFHVLNEHEEKDTDYEVTNIAGGAQKLVWTKPDGQKHRTNGPAVVVYDSTGALLRHEFWVNGLKHCYGHPAILNYSNGNPTSAEYWVDGQPCGKDHA